MDGAVKEYDADGKLVWEYQIPLFGKEPAPGHGPEAYGNHTFSALRLVNGNTLIATGNGHSLLEVTPEKKIVWRFKVPFPYLATRLENGNTLISDARLGKVIEVTADKRVVWKYESPDLANMRSRNAHRTDQGTTLIAVEAEGKLIEVDQAGKIVWEWQAPNGKNRRLYMGRRLANGNTVMSLSDPGELVEVDRAGNIVRHIGGTDPVIQMGWTSGFALLPDGGALLEYSLGDTASVVWIVTKSTAHAEYLPPKKEIEALALAAVNALTEPGRSSAGAFASSQDRTSRRNSASCAVSSKFMVRSLDQAAALRA